MFSWHDELVFTFLEEKIPKNYDLLDGSVKREGRFEEGLFLKKKYLL